MSSHPLSEYDAAALAEASDDASEVTSPAVLPPMAQKGDTPARLGPPAPMVQATRKSPDTERRYGELVLPSPEPWHEPVDGAKLLTGLAETFRRYVVMEDGAAEALALWTVHAHALDAFVFSPRLAITSAEKRCGKTTLLDVLGCLVPRPLPTANATAPAIFRSIELLGPTLLIDEADTFLRSNDELRGVLNSGHRRATASVIRLVGDDHRPCQFHTWAATAIAMIGGLPDTLADRSIEIRLRRRLPGEPVSRFRADRASDLAQLGRMAARWARDHLEALRNTDPPIPPGLNDRAADNWTPLLAIADLAGGEWPERAWRAIASMTFREGEETGSLGELLLADIRQVFVEIEQRRTTSAGGESTDLDRIRSSDLARILGDMEGRPWAEWGPRQMQLTPHGLARLLKPFGIRPATLRFHEKGRSGNNPTITDKGYLRSQFEDAFSRYLPPQAQPDPTVTPSQPQEIRQSEPDSQP